MKGPGKVKLRRLFFNNLENDFHAELIRTAEMDASQRDTCTIYWWRMYGLKGFQIRKKVCKLRRDFYAVSAMVFAKKKGIDNPLPLLSKIFDSQQMFIVLEVVIKLTMSILVAIFSVISNSVELLKFGLNYRSQYWRHLALAVLKSIR